MRRGRTGQSSYDDVPLSALLRTASSTYTAAVRRALSRIGCDDVPPTGVYVISAMHWSDASLDAVMRWMGVTKQAVGQSVDALVARGYLERSQDRSDRRRVNLNLTERGRAMGKAARTAIEQVDRELRDRLGVKKVAHTRAALVTLLEMERNRHRDRDPV